MDHACACSHINIGDMQGSCGVPVGLYEPTWLWVVRYKQWQTPAPRELETLAFIAVTRAGDCPWKRHGDVVPLGYMHGLWERPNGYMTRLPRTM